MDLGTLHHEVLQQLEDLRLAEWSDMAPPPPPVPAGRRGLPMGGHGPDHGGIRNYVNYPGGVAGHRFAAANEEPIYVPGAYQVSTIQVSKKAPAI